MGSGDNSCNKHLLQPLQRPVSGRSAAAAASLLPASLLPASLAARAAGFLEHLAARAYSQGSLDAHHWALKGFVEWADSQGLADPTAFTRSTIEEYQLHLHHYRSPRTGEPLATNTQLARLGCIRRFFAWLCRSGIIPANPADPFGLRNRTILEVFYATGIRRSELTKLDHGDYDPQAGTISIRQGKGGKSRMLPVGERAGAWLDRFLAESRPLFEHLPQETALFLSRYGTRLAPAYLTNWTKKLLIQCGIDKAGSCHLFRHSCATDMHRGGADIRYVQEWSGAT